MGRVHDDVRSADAGRYEAFDDEHPPECLEYRRDPHSTDAIQPSRPRDTVCSAAVAGDDHEPRRGAGVRHATGRLNVASAGAADGVPNAAGDDDAVPRAVPAERAA